MGKGGSPEVFLMAYGTLTQPETNENCLKKLFRVVWWYISRLKCGVVVVPGRQLCWCCHRAFQLLGRFCFTSNCDKRKYRPIDGIPPTHTKRCENFNLNYWLNKKHLLRNGMLASHLGSICRHAAFRMLRWCHFVRNAIEVGFQTTICKTKHSGKTGVAKVYFGH